MGENGPIILNNRKPLINMKGEIFIDGQLIDTFRVVQFADTGQIDSFNATIFYAIDENLKLIENPSYFIRQGYIEAANVTKAFFGEVPRFKYVYEVSTLVIKRLMKGYQSAMGMVGN